MAGGFKTKAEMATAVMRVMNVIDVTETEADYAEESAYVQEVYDQVYEDLVDREYGYWSPNEIPTVVFLPVRDLVVNMCQGAFGAPISPQDADMRQEIILKRLRRHTSVKKSDHTIGVSHF